MNDQADRGEILALTAEIVSSHVSNNNLTVAELADLIRTVHTSLAGAGEVCTVPDRPRPAVPIRRSITPDYIVCLENGKRLKTLKRHLHSRYNMTPEGYRERWGLPADYPMVAPNYAARRSVLAKEIGLGTKRRRKV